MFCTNCGNKNEPGVVFCSGCGQNLEGNTSTSTMQPSIYAGFWKRVAAYLIDGLLLGIVIGIPSYVISMIIFAGSVASQISELNGMEFSNMEGQMSQVNDAAQAAVALQMFAGMSLAFLFCGIIGTCASWLYFALMESSSKQGTLGKMALGIKVTDLDGNRISFGKATGRYFGKILSGMIMNIGFIMAAFTDKKQGLHDMLAKTLVLNK